jgi:ferredoxin
MKVKKEPLREDRYLNIRVDTYPMEFNALDALFHDLTNFTYCVILNDGERDIVLEFAQSKVEALLKHKETYDRLLLRPKQWFDVKERKFKYIEYVDADKTEKLSDIKTIDQKDLYKSFINEIQSLIVKGSNNGLTFYTKREATDYSRKVSFSIFSGLRVKVGQLKNTSYAELKQLDAKAVDNLVKFTDKELAKKFLTNLYNQGEEHERWEMFVDLLEAKISEYYKEGDRSTSEAPNYIILEEINKEVEARVALNKKPEKEGKDGGEGGGKADFTRKTKENVTGKFYVDDKCIICDACAIAAPKFFKLNEVNAFVYSQPTTPEEIELCNQALSGCPVAAIGNDGDIAAQAAAKPAPAPVAAKVEAPAPKAVEVKKEETKAVDPATIEKEIEDMKDLLGKVSIEKLNEIKALLQASVQVETPAQEVVEVTSTPVEEVVSAPTSGAKALPATAPDGSKVFPENIAGMFYVDEKCIECNACVDIAPNFFVIDNGHAFVFAQPTNDSEIEQCKEALGGCPVGSININE